MAETRKKGGEAEHGVPAVEQAARVLFCLAGSSSAQMGLLEIADQAGLHKGRAYSILQTLEKFGLVQKHGDRKGFSLGPGLITLSRKVLDDIDASRLAEPLLKDLAVQFGVTATLGLISDRNVFVVAKQEGGAAIGVTIRTGHRFPLSYGSHGKAIAAALPPEELAQLLAEEKLYFHGAAEMLDRSRLEGELAQCRRDGFALDLGEMKQGLNSVAATVFGPKTTPIGYIAVIGLFSNDEARACGPSVAEAAKTLSRQLGARVE